MHIQPPSEPSTPTNVHAEENNDNQVEFTNPFCIPVQENAESSSRNMYTFNQPQDSEYRWTKITPLNSSSWKSIQASAKQDDNFNDDSAWIEACMKELHQFNGLQIDVPIMPGCVDTSNSTSGGRSYALSYETCHGDSLISTDHRIHKDGDGDASFQLKVGNIIEAYQVFEDMLKGFDREDLVTLWSLVKERFRSAEPTKDKERALWVELKRLFEPDKDDVL
ncbi:hypothetical protein Tco_1173394 [Tanacetum coccineum]